MIVTLSSIGLPGLNGFVGEFLILLGAFQKSVPLAVLAASGVILAAVYMLWMFKRAVFGPLDKEENRTLKDLNGREIATLVPLVVLIVWIGVYPQTFLRKMDRSVEVFLARTASAQPTAVVVAEPPAEIAGIEETVAVTLEPEGAVPDTEPTIAEPSHPLRLEEDLVVIESDRPQPDDHGER